MSDRHKKRLKVDVDPHLLDRLRAFAAQREMTVAEIVRFCIKHTLPLLEDKYQSPAK